MRPSNRRRFRATVSLLMATATTLGSLGGVNLAIAGGATPRAETSSTTRPLKAAAKRFIKAEGMRPAVPKLGKRHVIGGLSTEARGADGRIFSEVIEFSKGSLGTRLLAVAGLRPVSAVAFSYRKGFRAGDGSANHDGFKVSRTGALVSKMFDVNGVHGYAQTEFIDGARGGNTIERSESIGARAARDEATPSVERRISRVDGKIRIRSSYSHKLTQLGASIEYHRDEAETGDDATHTFKIRTIAGQDYVAIALDAKGEITVDATNMKAGRQGSLSIFGSKAAVSSLKRLIQGSKQLGATDKARLEASLDAAHASAF